MSKTIDRQPGGRWTRGVTTEETHVPVPGRRTLADPAAGGIRACSELARGLAQRKAVSAAPVPGRAQQVLSRASSDSGAPADPVVLGKVEAATGAKLDGVRVHTGAGSQEAAAALNARAYTFGQHLHFGAGQYRPGTADGDHLLAHELAHAAQQGRGASRMQAKLKVSTPDDSAESEADVIADAALTGGSATVTPTTDPVLHRVRLSADDNQSVVTSAWLIGSLKLPKNEGSRDCSKELAGLLNGVFEIVNELLTLTADEDSDPERAARATSIVKGIRTSYPKISRLLDETSEVPDGFVARAEKAAELLDQVHERETKRNKRDEQDGADKEIARKKKLGDQLASESKNVFGKGHKKSWKRLEGKEWEVSSIRDSLERLAGTGRLPEIADALDNLFAEYKKEKASSAFHGDYFGVLGGKDKLTKLVASALHNVAWPEKIFQGSKGTCGAAVEEMLIAIHEPARYIQLVRQLASKEGFAEVMNAKLQRNEATTKDDESMRNPASRLLQPALMVHARPDDAYSNKADKFEKGVLTDRGLPMSKIGSSSTALLGKDYKESSSAELRIGMTDDPVLASLSVWRREKKDQWNHEVLLLHADEKAVCFANSAYGRVMKMDVSDFKNLGVSLLKPEKQRKDPKLSAWKKEALGTAESVKFDDLVNEKVNL